MEIIAIFVSSLIAIISSVGIVVETRIAEAIQKRVERLDTIAVRVDSRPNYSVSRANIKRLRIATRGLEPIAGVRIEALELETGEIKTESPKAFQNLPQWRQVPLNKPLDLGVRVEILEADLQAALNQPSIKVYLNQFLSKVSEERLARRHYQLVSLDLDFQEGQKLQIRAELNSPTEKQTHQSSVVIWLNCGIKIVSGKQIAIIEPVVTINGRKVSSRLLQSWTKKINERLDLEILEAQGLTVRIFNLEINEGGINIAAFVHLQQLPPIYVQ